VINSKYYENGYVMRKKDKYRMSSNNAMRKKDKYRRRRIWKNL
jgi:hypothetical protein